MLKQRVLTAVVLLAIFLPVTLFAPTDAPIDAFAALIALVLVFAAWEWARLLGLAGLGPLLYALLAALALVAATAGLGGSSGHGFYQASAIFWIAAVPFALVRKPVLVRGPWRVFLLVAGVVVLIACWYALVTARRQGAVFVLSLLLVVWLADIGAYFTGKAFGRRKLAPAISPGKTWEGVFGGGLLVLLCAALAMALGSAAPAAGLLPNLFVSFAAHLGWPRALLGIIVLVAFSVIGDLFESLLKRQAGVKDSSGLLPGHGGVLDRIDALLPVLPLAMLLLG